MLAASVMCLALNIYFEARDQPVDGQIMVAEVTLNRVMSKAYPNTICEVVWQPGAFSWTHDGKSDKPKDAITFAEIVLLSDKLLNDSSLLLGTTATHYHEKSIHPYWADVMVKLGQVGDHIFYEET